MKRTYIITGTSRGIGRAIVECILESTHDLIYGHSRGESVQHERYHHSSSDLSEVEVLAGFEFPEPGDADEIVLVNNAGTLGEIGRLGSIPSNDIARTLFLNLSGPMMLTNRFLETYKKSGKRLIILNISSGAAQHPIEAWSSYCASKAGLDMFSEVGQVEADRQGWDVQYYSVAPGVVETEMQAIIRGTDANTFSEVDRFISMKEENQLRSTREVAVELLNLLNSGDKTVVQRLA